MSLAIWIKEALGLTKAEIEEAVEEMKKAMEILRTSFTIDKFGIRSGSSHLMQATDKVSLS